MDDPRDAEIDEVSSRLADGLKACRTLVSNYRAMITGEETGDWEDGASQAPSSQSCSASD